MLICLGHTHQHEARVVTCSFDVCLNSNIDDTNTMAKEGNKDVVFPQSSVMNAPAVCSIDFNPKLQIESSDEKIILILTGNDYVFFFTQDLCICTHLDVDNFMSLMLPLLIAIVFLSIAANP